MFKLPAQTKISKTFLIIIIVIIVAFLIWYGLSNQSKISQEEPYKGQTSIQSWKEYTSKH